VGTRELQRQERQGVCQNQTATVTPRRQAARGLKCPSSEIDAQSRLTRNVQLWPTVSYNVCPSPRLLHSTYVPSRIQPCADLILAPYEPDLERTTYRRRTVKQPNKPSAAGELTHPEIPAPTPAHDFQFSGSCLMSQGFLASDPAARPCGETLRRDLALSTTDVAVCILGVQGDPSTTYGQLLQWVSAGDYLRAFAS
jgi:hypothetical protein